MADKTHIEWVKNADGEPGASWNVITGCSLASPGCSRCYAMRLAGTRLRHHPSRVGLTHETRSGPVWTGEVRFNQEWLDQPLRWKKPRAIFVAAHGDLFHDGVSDEVLDQIFAVMAIARQHTFQVLTKRAARMRAYTSDTSDARMAARRAAIRRLAKDQNAELAWPLPNVWLGVSVEDQKRADERVPDLLMTPAAVRWISAEPLLGEVHLGAIAMELPWRDGPGTYNALEGRWTPAVWDAEYENRTTESGLARIDWVVVGGESGGEKALPMLPAWARSLRDQCAAAQVPFFFKQWGEWHTAAIRTSDGQAVFRQFQSYEQWVAKANTWVNGGICLDRLGRRMERGADMQRARDEGTFPVTIMHRVGKRQAGRLLDGVLHDAYPHGAGITRSAETSHG